MDTNVGFDWGVAPTSKSSRSSQKAKESSDDDDESELDLRQMNDYDDDEDDYDDGDHGTSWMNERRKKVNEIAMLKRKINALESTIKNMQSTSMVKSWL